MWRNHRISEPRLVENFVGIALERRARKDAKLRAERGAPGEIEGNSIDGDTVAQVLDIEDDTAQIVKNVLSGLGNIQGQKGESAPETNMLQTISIDQTTQIIIPLYLRRADVFSRVLQGKRSSLFLSEINESMVKTLSGIDIQLQSGETTITTQMYQRININGVETTLGDSILNSQISKLREIQ